MQNKLIFNKRTDIWQKYRDEILFDSIRISQPLHNNKKIEKIISNINVIDKNILVDLNASTTIKLAGAYQVDTDLTHIYEPLRFSIPLLDNNYLEGIKENMDKANLIQLSRFILSENEFGKLLPNKLNSFEEIEETMIPKIKNNLTSIETEIQKFPSTSNIHLKLLENTLTTIKNPKNQRHKKINNFNIDDSFNFQKFLYIIIALLGVFAIAGILVFVLALVL